MTPLRDKSLMITGVSLALILLSMAPSGSLAFFIQPSHFHHSSSSSYFRSLLATPPVAPLDGPSVRLSPIKTKLNPTIRRHQQDIDSCCRSTATTATTRLQAIPSRLSSISSPILSMAVLMTIVLVHELGHYLPAKMFRIDVMEFSIGAGPKLYGFKAWGNEFNLRWIPIGGYVRFAGEHDYDDEEEKEKARKEMDTTMWLENRPWWERAVVLSGGVVFNLLFSYCLYLGLFVNTGILKQDVSIAKLARSTALYTYALIKTMATGLCNIMLEVAKSAIFSIGNFWLKIFRTLLSPFWKNPSIVQPLISQASSSMAAPLSQIGGPVQVVQAGSNVAQHHGILPLLHFAGHLSLNLGVVNAFPLPVLDGGRLAFVLFEAITGRKVNQRVETAANTICTLLLLWFIFFTSWRDLRFLIFAQ